jgi:pimeloyl-ACP methyl ester carboxylesterase
MHGLAAFFERFLTAVGVEEHMLVLHDWGALALIAEQRHPERLRRLVILNAVPLLPGFRWHWVARLWRRRGVGELLNATTTRPATALLLRQARPGWKPMPPEFVDMIDRHFDAGTKHAVLELYRSADEPKLAQAGNDLGLLDCPALVVWGGKDAYLPPEFGPAYTEKLPNAELLALPDAGHWPWVDRPDTIARVLNFLSSA